MDVSIGVSNVNHAIKYPRQTYTMRAIYIYTPIYLVRLRPVIFEGGGGNCTEIPAGRSLCYRQFPSLLGRVIPQLQSRGTIMFTQVLTIRPTCSSLLTVLG